MDNEVLSESLVQGLALEPQAVGNSAVYGPDIEEPWKIGRQLSINMIAGAMTTNDALTITLQGKKWSDGTYAALTDLDGNSLTFTTTKTADTKELENGSIVGTIPLSCVNAETHSAIRVAAVNAVAQNVQLAGTYVLGDLYSKPSGQTDDLVAKVLQAASAE